MLKPLKLFKVSLLFFISILHFTSFAQSNDVDNFIAQVMEDRMISGLQLAVIQNGKVTKLGSYGLANIEHKVPVEDNTIFPLNSITKAFTGVALMTLVEEGRIDLSAKISTYLDSLPKHWKEITVRDLASHTAGLPYIKDPANEGNYLSDAVGDAEWSKVLSKPVLFLPGEKFDYNQLGYAILGLIIEEITGQGFEDYIKAEQLEVAGMNNTSFGDFHIVIPNKAQSYTAYNGTYYNVYEAIPDHLMTATGMNSTALDVAHWVIALLKGKILKDKKHFKALSEPFHLKDGSLAGFNGAVNGYGVGWPFIDRQEHPAMAAIGGGRSAVFIYPEDDIAIVIITNRRGCAPEQFVDEIAGFYIPEMKASNGFGFPPEFRILSNNIGNDDSDSAIRAYKKLKSDKGDLELPENLINSWGYKILRAGNLKKALAVFKLNVHLYPDSANTYDSYAEVLLLNGEIQEAEKNYRRSLELNPENKNAAQQLKSLENKK